jgi:hypothetical protein
MLALALTCRIVRDVSAEAICARVHISRFRGDAAASASAGW